MGNIHAFVAESRYEPMWPGDYLFWLLYPIIQATVILLGACVDNFFKSIESSTGAVSTQLSALSPIPMFIITLFCYSKESAQISCAQSLRPNLAAYINLPQPKISVTSRSGHSPLLKLHSVSTAAWLVQVWPICRIVSILSAAHH